MSVSKKENSAMDRLKNRLLLYIMMGMFMLTAGIGVGRFSLTDVTPTSVVEEVSVENEQDEKISALSITYEP